MLNRIDVQGRLTRDPELRQTQSGVPVCTFSIACERDFKDPQTGQKGTDFLEIVAWRHTANFVSKYLTKGQTVVVSGRLQNRDYTDRNGQNRRLTEIVADNCYACQSLKHQETQTQGQQGYQNQRTDEEDDPDLPF